MTGSIEIPGEVARRSDDAVDVSPDVALQEPLFDDADLRPLPADLGYRGPIGLMCYGIPGDVREHLERSMKTWRAWTAQQRK